jgi:DNA-binding HxlR family transcriptional regulator
VSRGTRLAHRVQLATDGFRSYLEAVEGPSGRGDKRYSEVRNAIEGLSEKMLAQTLRELERDGLVLRTSFPVVPPHVVYSLTPLGNECARHLSALLHWIETHVTDLKSARRKYDAASRARVA